MNGQGKRCPKNEGERGGRCPKTKKEGMGRNRPREKEREEEEDAPIGTKEEDTSTSNMLPRAPRHPHSTTKFSKQ